jgi:hypothetical protein
MVVALDNVKSPASGAAKRRSVAMVWLKTIGPSVDGGDGGAFCTDDRH